MHTYRHGDLSFHPLEKAPKNIKEIKKDGSFVLALGEATGHKHVLTEEKPGSFNVYQDEKDRYVLQVVSPSRINHQEHKTLVIEPGWYVQEREREMDWFSQAVKQVVD